MTMKWSRPKPTHNRRNPNKLIVSREAIATFKLTSELPILNLGFSISQTTTLRHRRRSNSSILGSTTLLSDLKYE